MRTIFTLAFLAFTATAHAQTPVEFLCDTDYQAARFVEALGFNPSAAANEVNLEAKTPNACVVEMFIALPVEDMGTFRTPAGLWKIQKVVVVAIRTPQGLRPIPPAEYFTAKKLEEA